MSRVGGFLLSLLNKILPKNRPRTYISRAGVKGLDQIARMIRYQRWGDFQ